MGWGGGGLEDGVGGRLEGSVLITTITRHGSGRHGSGRAPYILMVVCLGQGPPHWPNLVVVVVVGGGGGQYRGSVWGGGGGSQGRSGYLSTTTTTR